MPEIHDATDDEHVRTCPTCGLSRAWADAQEKLVMARGGELLPAKEQLQVLAMIAVSIVMCCKDQKAAWICFHEMLTLELAHAAPIDGQRTH